MPNLQSGVSRFTALWTVFQAAVVFGVLGTSELQTPGAAWGVLVAYAFAAGVALWGGRAILCGDAPPRWIRRAQVIMGRFPWLLLIVAGAFLFWLWGGEVLTGHGETLATLVRFGATGITAFGLVALLVWGREADHNLRHIALVIAIFALIIAVLLPLLTVADYPRLDDTDEPWNLNIGWTFAETGQLYAHMYLGANSVPNPLLTSASYPLAIWLKVFGLGIVQGRLYQFVWKALLLLLIYDTTRRLYDRPSALLAVTFAAMTTALFDYGMLVRGDGPLAAMIALGFWLYVMARQRESNLLHLLSGLAFSLSINAHQNGLVFALAFGAAYTLSFVLQLRRDKRFSPDWRWLAFVAGGLLGGLAFLLASHQPIRQFSPEFQIYTAQSGYFFPITTFDPGLIFGLEWTRLLRYGRSAVFEMPLLLLAVLAAWWRGQESDRLLLGLLGLVALGYLMIVSSDSVFYLVHPQALLAPLVGALLWRGLGWFHKQPAVAWGRAIAITVTVAAMLGPDFGRLSTILNEGHNRRFFACAAESADLFPPDAMLYLDEPVLWLAYLDAERYADHHVLDIWAATRGLSAEESMAEIAPDVTLSMYGGRPEGVNYAQEHGYLFLDETNGGVACWTMWVNPAVLTND